MDALRYSYGSWQCHLDARASGAMPSLPTPATDKGRQLSKAVLEQARSLSRKNTRAAEGREYLIGLTSWRDTPYEYRRMLAIMASLPPSLADRSDRELTENEKALLRVAAKRVSEGIRGLAASL